MNWQIDKVFCRLFTLLFLFVGVNTMPVFLKQSFGIYDLVRLKFIEFSRYFIYLEQ